MKQLILLIVVSVLSAGSSYAQSLLEINAVQESDERYIGYEDYNSENELIGDPMFMPGCSWYCGGYVKEITSSSELKGNGTITYGAKNAHDFDIKTAWVEGDSGHGIGQFLEYEFNFDELKNYGGTLGITKIIIANGYKKNKKLWKANSRVKQLKMFVNNKEYAVINLLDSYEVQTVNIEKIMFPPETTTTVKFQILDVYPGTKYRDTAITELVFDGVGVH